jgi:hypothetical protein
MAEQPDERPEPKKKGCMNAATVTSITTAVVGGILMALQGVTLHQADGVQRETVRVGAETSAELQAIQDLQRSSNEELAALKQLQNSANIELQEWAELREKVALGLNTQAELLARQNKLTDIAAKILPRLSQSLKDDPSPTPSPSPNH